MLNLFSPLEQFAVLPLISLFFGGFDFSITNETTTLFLTFFLLSSLFIGISKSQTSSLYIMPHFWQFMMEFIYKMVLSMIIDNIGKKKGGFFFPLIFSLFFFILSLNTIGLMPYSFTLTSHLIVTFALSLFLFIGLNIICIQIHGLEFFSLFLPQGTSFFLALLLVPIELMSYFFKPMSLSIRLFANMMAGHTLLKVMVGFSWTLMKCTGILFLIHFFPLMILIPLFGLELGVALIQSFVFSVLMCIYLNDAINLH